MPVITVDPDRLKTHLLAYAANKRWQVEIAGTLDGDDRPIATDRDSQGKLMADMIAIQAGLRTDPSGWKLADGSFAMLTNAQMMGAITAARDHVVAAFATEAAVVAAIISNTITTTAQIDEADWPA